jgi:molybdate transport system substrate-binding protein
MIHRLGLWLTVFWILFSIGIVCAETANVAVAANFTTAAKALVQEFERNNNHKIKLSFGSTGKIYAQISHGAPFAVFLSADTERPAILVQRGLAVENSQFTYATGKLALYSRVLPIIDSDIKTLLSGDNIIKVAIANPKTAPYGAAAEEAMKSLKIEHTLRKKIIKGESISQTFQFAYSKNASVGFVAASQVIGRAKGQYQLIPESIYTPIRQDAVILKSGAKNTAATEFFEFLKSPKAKQMMTLYGYGVSQEISPH